MPDDYPDGNRRIPGVRRLRRAPQENSSIFRRPATALQWRGRSLLSSRHQGVPASGGFVLWIEFDSGIDTTELAAIAINKYRIAVAPGCIFSANGKNFRNCLRDQLWLPVVAPDRKCDQDLGQTGEERQRVKGVWRLAFRRAGYPILCICDRPCRHRSYFRAALPGC